MGLMDHKFGLVALGLLAVFGLLFLVGFSAPVWISETGTIPNPSGYITVTTTAGLWKWCVSGVCEALDKLAGSVQDYWRATQAMESLALIALFGGGILLLVSFFQTRKVLSILAMLGIFAAAGFSMLGVIIFGAKVDSSLGYCFYLTLVASLGMVASGVLVAVDMQRSTPN